MNNSSKSLPSAEFMEDMLRGELAHGDVILSTTRPILRHLLANEDHSLFSDEVIARIRGMMINLARQMLFALAERIKAPDMGAFVENGQDALATALLEDASLLGHAHALTIEAQLAERLQQRSGIDTVLSPLLQELAASSDPSLAAAAMRIVAAQAKFMQHQRRMELPLGELPAELFHAVTGMLRTNSGDLGDQAEATCDALRQTYDESERRIGQITRLVVALNHQAKRALSVDNAGLAIFVTGLSMASRQERDVVVLSLGENQAARLAISLRAAGLGQSAVEEQFLYLHPEIELPDGFDALRVDRAAALLASSAPAETAH
ncbi:hypothetical protein [Aurantiacibacter poecillastricola]|uniref:hypothetical protein n=1 Tax=Aurantiacibacter poecillastricola TaxID=3064385 RepID=UPI00273EB101|nr:hypothetical protein [Aurantiacibacter sp. 219JJ12-13]MDP5262108.1 hypothetical protein [Aurantiacibacter sp. 219JJ12-13]